MMHNPARTPDQKGPIRLSPFSLLDLRISDLYQFGWIAIPRARTSRDRSEAEGEERSRARRRGARASRSMVGAGERRPIGIIFARQVRREKRACSANAERNPAIAPAHRGLGVADRYRRRFPPHHQGVAVGAGDDAGIAWPYGRPPSPLSTIWQLTRSMSQ